MENLESQVIKKCQAGELKQFGQLYDSYIKKIYNFVYYKTWHRQTAEDLTSQTFFKALTKIKQFDEIKGSFSSWLYKIARNTVIDYYRQNKADLNIDDIIHVIRTADEPKKALEKKFKLSEKQADAILEIKLRQLAKLEEIKIKTEQAELAEEQAELAALLKSEQRLKTFIKKELSSIKDSMSDFIVKERRNK